MIKKKIFSVFLSSSLSTHTIFGLLVSCSLISQQEMEESCLNDTINGDISLLQLFPGRFHHHYPLSSCPPASWYLVAASSCEITKQFRRFERGASTSTSEFVRLKEADLLLIVVLFRWFLTWAEMISTFESSINFSLHVSFLLNLLHDLSEQIWIFWA